MSGFLCLILDSTFKHRTANIKLQNFLTFPDDPSAFPTARVNRGCESLTAIGQFLTMQLRMELSWINKLRIGLVAVLGIVVIGILCWPLAAPRDPLGPVRVGDLGFVGVVVLMLVAFIVGAIAYLVSWPHGREMGILAVPFGLSIWGLRSGPMAALYQAANTVAKRTGVSYSLLLEPLSWLLVVAAGFAGVLAAQRLAAMVIPTPSTDQADQATKTKGNVTSKTATTFVIAVLVSVIAAWFFVTATAKDVPPFNGVVATQPPNGQIAFAVIVAFAAAAFIAKQFLGLNYILPAVATVFLGPTVQAAYGGMIQTYVDTQPATFFPNSTLTVLPLQLVAFGAIGSVVGYWLAIRYRYWRTHLTA
jgi:hypothetical protein